MDRFKKVLEEIDTDILLLESDYSYMKFDGIMREIVFKHYNRTDFENDDLIIEFENGIREYIKTNPCDKITAMKNKIIKIMKNALNMTDGPVIPYINIFNIPYNIYEYAIKNSYDNIKTRGKLNPSIYMFDRSYLKRDIIMASFLEEEEELFLDYAKHFIRNNNINKDSYDKVQDRYTIIENLLLMLSVINGSSEDFEERATKELISVLNKEEILITPLIFIKKFGKSLHSFDRYEKIFKNQLDLWNSLSLIDFYNILRAFFEDLKFSYYGIHDNNSSIIIDKVIILMRKNLQLDNHIVKYLFNESLN